MSLHTTGPRYQTLPVGISWVSNVRSLPEEIRCCPKHSTRLVAVFVAVKRTTSTRTFLYIQLSQQISIYRDIYAHATPADGLSGFFCFHEPRVPKLSRVSCQLSS